MPNTFKRTFQQHPTLPDGFSITLPERFWSKVNKFGPTPDHKPELGPCWVWTAARDGHGYGHIQRGRREAKTDRSHRVSWLLHFGTVPEGLGVLHKCDNPLCVRPDHLFLGTRLENNRDSSKKGRRRSCAHRLTFEDAVVVRELHSYFGMNHRQIARLFGHTPSCICLIVNLRTHVRPRH